MLTNLYSDLMKLCAENEAFYFVDHHFKGEHYRVFTYRLASYSDFLLPGALECRGHTFHMGPSFGFGWDGEPVLVSLPMQKFFNVGENPMTMDLDWSQVERIDDKLDGSLISSVKTRDGFTLKSKTSFTSEQAVAAVALLHSPEYARMLESVKYYVDLDCTVNMEYTAPTNQIVIGYSKPQLRVLNIRDNVTGEYLSGYNGYKYMFPDEFLCQSLPFTEVTQEMVDEISKMEGIEGYVFTFKNGLKAKLKTDWYCALHLQKDQISNPRRLFEAVINETSDDLKGLFGSDPVALARIEEMEVKAKALYNRLHKLVESFYQDNKELSRKDFAIKGQEELKKDGVFSLAMNLYIGRDMNLKEHLTKNYKSYGITDTEHTASE